MKYSLHFLLPTSRKQHPRNKLHSSSGLDFIIMLGKSNIARLYSNSISYDQTGGYIFSSNKDPKSEQFLNSRPQLHNGKYRSLANNFIEEYYM